MTCEDFTAVDLKAAGGTMVAPGAGAGGIGGTWWYLSRRQMPGEMGAPPFLLMYHPFSFDMSGGEDDQMHLRIMPLMKETLTNYWFQPTVSRDGDRAL